MTFWDFVNNNPGWATIWLLSSQLFGIIVLMALLDAYLLDQIEIDSFDDEEDSFDDEEVGDEEKAEADEG